MAVGDRHSPARALCFDGANLLVMTAACSTSVHDSQEAVRSLNAAPVLLACVKGFSVLPRFPLGEALSAVASAVSPTNTRRSRRTALQSYSGSFPLTAFFANWSGKILTFRRYGCLQRTRHCSLSLTQRLRHYFTAIKFVDVRYDTLLRKLPRQRYQETAV